MLLRMGRRTLLTVAVAVLLVTSGCAGLQVLDSDDEASPPDVNVVERYESLETLEATRETSVDHNGSVNETRTAVRIDFTHSPPRRFQRVLGPESRAGDVTVVNESGSLVYDADENAVTRVPSAETRTLHSQNRSEYIASIVAAARDGEEVDTDDSVSPLPVVPASSGAPRISPDEFDGFEVEYLGTDTVAGRTAHGFELRAASEAALAVNQTLWLDDEYFYPLKSHQEFELENRTVETSMEVTNVTFNADLSADAFEFEVPENATVEVLDRSESFDSVAGLQEATNLTVPEPVVPENYEVENARLVEDNFTRISVQYTDGSDAITVVKMDEVPERSDVLSSGENVTVAGRDATYLTTGQSNLVTWTCEDTQYSVISTDLDREALVAVADSVGCE